MDGTSVAILVGVVLIVIGALWAARGRSGLDGTGTPVSEDPNVHRGERGGTGAGGGGN
jgi:hypothetical protein